ncbi:MAG: GtrA family protein [Alphaproteobacteria bacterium]|nr:GtrA family protein [Alphaproteobacteria bacterium]
MTKSRGRAVQSWLAFWRRIDGRLTRWLMAGFLLAALNLAALSFFREVLSWSLMVATLATAEVSTCLRFLVNDRWVFGNPRPSWGRFVRFHLTVAGSFVVWWSITNGSAAWGIHYLAASLLGNCGTVGWSLATNFLWVWRRSHLTSQTPPRRGL